MKIIICIVFLFFSTISTSFAQTLSQRLEPGPYVVGVVPNQSSDDHHIKYWYYRWRLREHFVKIGKNGGESLVAQLKKTKNKTGDPNAGSEINTHLRYSDQTIFLGFYIGVLATEYHFLHKNHQNTDQTVKELYHALWALNRLDAGSENYYNNIDPVPDINTVNEYSVLENYNGFLLRSDADRNYFDYSHFENSPVPSIYDSVPSTIYSEWVNHKYYENGAPWVGDTVTRQAAFDYRHAHGRNEPSQDQIIYLYAGLALVRKYIPEHVQYEINGSVQYFNGKDYSKTSLAEVARRITLRIAAHCNSTNYNAFFGDWNLRNKSRADNATFSDGRLVHTGGHMAGLAVGIANVGCYSIQKSYYQSPCKPSSFPQYAGGWATQWIGGSSGTDRSIQNWWTKNILGKATYKIAREMGAFNDNFAERFNRHMANTLCAINNRSWNSLLPTQLIPFTEGNQIVFHYQSIEASQSDYAYLLRTALHGNIFDFKPNKSVINKYYDLLSTAPCTGPYKYVDEKTQELVYGNINWSTDDRLLHPERNNKKEFLGEYNGIDYMLNHNLFYLSVNDKYSNPINLIEHSVTKDLPENNNIGIVGNVLVANAFREITASNTIKSTSPDGTPSDVKYRAGVVVCLEPGFSTEDGSSFETILQPFVCNGIDLKREKEEVDFDGNTSNIFGFNYSDDYQVDEVISDNMYDPNDIIDKEPVTEMDLSWITEDDYDLLGNPDIKQLMGLDSSYNVSLTELIENIKEEELQNYVDSIENIYDGNNSRKAVVENDLFVNVSPNPVQKELIIEIQNMSEGEVELIIDNSIGQNLIRYFYSNPNFHSLDISYLDKGIYTVTIMINDKKFTTKISKL